MPLTLTVTAKDYCKYSKALACACLGTLTARGIDPTYAADDANQKSHDLITMSAWLFWKFRKLGLADDLIAILE